jgi:predicted MFS family arabinose efflux permease
MFVGMASGAALGSALLAGFGWRAVPVLGALAALGALAVAFAGRHAGPAARG